MTARIDSSVFLIVAFFGLGFVIIAQHVPLDTMAPKSRVKRKAATAVDDDPILTDIDSDSELEQYRVRLPKGLPLDALLPDRHEATDHPVEQECQRQLRNRYIGVDLFSWLPQQLESDYLRASALCRRGLQTMTFTAGTFYHAGTVGIRSNTKNPHALYSGIYDVQCAYEDTL